MPEEIDGPNEETMTPDETGELIAALAHRFWSIHPREIQDMGITREQFYAQEIRRELEARRLTKPALNAISAALESAVAGDGFDGGDFDGMDRRHFERARDWVHEECGRRRKATNASLPAVATDEMVAAFIVAFYGIDPDDVWTKQDRYADVFRGLEAALASAPTAKPAA